MNSVINASPLIALAKADLLGILPKLFDQVAIPAGVADEILAGPTDDAMRIAFPTAGWLRRVTVTPPVTILASIQLGLGETEVIEWARLHSGSVAILDDRAARRVAVALGIPVIGTLGVVARAAHDGLVASFADAVEDLRASGLYVSEEIVAAVDRKLQDTTNHPCPSDE